MSDRNHIIKYRIRRSLTAFLLTAVMFAQTVIPSYAATPGIEGTDAAVVNDTTAGLDEQASSVSEASDPEKEDNSEIDENDQTETASEGSTESIEETGEEESTEEANVIEPVVPEKSKPMAIEKPPVEYPDSSNSPAMLGAVLTSGDCSATESDNVTWELDDEGTLTISGTGAMEDYSYAGAAPWYGQRSNVKKIVVGDGVTSIGKYAFGSDSSNEYSKLTEVELPENGVLESIGEKAFRYEGNLRCDLVIPESVTNIGKMAFNRTGIKSLTFAGTGDVTMGEDAFSVCESMTSTTLREGMTSLCEWMYEKSQITELEIPSTVTQIKKGAFSNCSKLEIIIVAENSLLTDISTDRVFEGCSSLESIEFEDGGSLTSVPSIQYLSSLKTVRLPKTVTSFPSSPFYGCSNLEAVYIEPDSTGQSTYYSDSFGKVITRSTGAAYYTPPKYSGFPDGITEITAETLASKKTVLTTVEIPATVTSIAEGAFDGFTKLTTVTFAAGSALVTIGENAFKDCISLTEITLPASLTSFEENSFEGCDALEAVTIADGNEVYRNGTGTDDTGIVYLIDGGSIFFIPPACATTLQPNAITARWVEAHVGEEQTAFQVQSHVTTIAAGAFAGYDKLANITFESGSSLKNVGSSAFKDCTGLESITLPTTLTSLSDTAFDGCTNLATVNIGAGGKANGGTVYYSENGVVYLTEGDYVWYQPLASTVDLWPVHLTAEWVADKYPTVASVTSVTIPKYVRTIEDEAFSGYSSLATVTLAEGSILESIGSKAFYGCTSLETISLPATLAYFDATSSNASFKGCTKLEEIIIAEENTKYSSNQGIVFLLSTGKVYYQPEGNDVLIWPDKPDTTFISNNFPKATTEEVVVPVNVTKLPDSAFNGYSKLKTVTFQTGSALTSVGNYAFASCSKLETITLPVGVKTVGEKAFNSCNSLTTWPLSGNTALTTIGDRAFQGCSALTTAGIPATVTSIGVAEFDGCSSLTEFNFEAATSTFGSKLNNSLFEGCTSLTSLTIPTGITQIGNSTFKNCSALVTITGLDFANTTVIGDEAFSGCLVLELGNVSLPRITSLTDKNFMDCRKLTTVSLGAMTDLDGKVFMGCTGLTSVSFPLGDNAKLTRLGYYSDSNVFNGCTSLTTITLPKTLSNFPQHTFDGCSSLETIFIEEGNNKYYSTAEGLVKLKSDDSVYIKPPAYGGAFEIPADATTIIPDYYKGNTKMTSIVIPARITSIEPNAFEGCTGLVSVTFEAGSRCANIGKEAFKGCTSLTTIPFPTALTTIGEGAFRGCTSLEIMAVPTTLTSLGSSAFRECTALESITIPASVEEIPSNLCNGCTALTDITIASGITRINENAFNLCTSLVSVSIPGSVKYVNGFNNCSSLTGVTFEEGVLTINGFNDCDALVSLTIPASCTTLSKPDLMTCDNLANVYIATGSRKYVNRAELPGIVFTTDGTLYLIPPASTVDNIWPVPVTNEWLKAHFPTETTTELEIPGYVTSFNANIFDYWLDGYSNLEKITFSEDSVCETTPVFAPPTDNGAIVPGIIAPTALEEVVLPASVKRIKNRAFNDMTSLEKVSFTAAPTSLIIGNQSFAGCTNLSDFTIPATTTTIWSNAFAGCNKLTIDAARLSNVTYFGKECFKDYLKLTGRLTVASGARILSNAFSGTGITEAVIPADVTYGSTEVSPADYGYDIFNGSKLQSVTINGTKIPSTCFANCTDLTTATMPNVTEIGGSVFYGCTNLSSVSSLKNVTKIDVRAFQDCTGLTGALDLPKLKTLGYNAFSGCTGITSAVIPATVTSLGEEVFSGCSNLSNLALNATAPIPEGIVENCPNLRTVTITNATSIKNDAFTSAVFESITIPATVKSIGRRAFKDCDMLSTIIIPNSVEEIDENAFSGCDRLASVTVTKGDKALRIKDYAFAGCVSLLSITLPSNVSGCGGRCFENCRSLRSFSMDGSPQDGIGYGAFTKCTSLETVKLPNITRLDEYLFSGCTSLEAITLPASLTYIGSHVFEDTHISEIEIPASVNTIKEDAFADCGDLREFKVKSGNTTFKAGTGNGDKKGWLYKKTNSDWVLFLIPPGWAGESEDSEFRIPEEMTVIKWDAFAGNKSIRHLVIPASVVEIKGSAFRGCENLETVTVENGSVLDYIGVLAFAGCTNLRTVEFQGTSVLSAIDQEAFKDCNSLQSISFADNLEDIELGNESFAGAYMLTGIYNGNDNAKLGKIGYHALGDTAIESLTLGTSCTVIYEHGLPTALKQISVVDGNTVFHTEDAGTKLYEGSDLIWSLNSSIYTVPASATNYAQLFEAIKCDDNNEYTEIAVEDGNTAFAAYDGALYSADGKILYCVPTAWNGGVFTVRTGTETIGDFAFLYCANISRVTLPNGVKTIGYGAFAGIESYPNMIRRIDIPGSVDTISSVKAFESAYSPTVYTPFDYNTTDSDFDEDDELVAALRIYGPEDTFVERYLKEHHSVNLYYDFDRYDYFSGGSKNQYISSSGQAFYINYELPDDAVNDPSNPTVYRSGNIELKPASRPNYHFAGWFTDPSCADEFRIDVLTPENAWGYTLYAGWNIYSGWIKNDNGIWYYYENGEILKNSFVTVGDNTYYLTADGSRAVGATVVTTVDPDTHETTTATYYFNRKGVEQTGWISDGNGKHYYDPDNGGAMAAGTWVGEGKDRIYVDEEGNRKTAGAANIDGKEYYLDSNGQVRTGWIKVGEDWFYYNSSTENYGARITAADDNDPDTNVTMQIVISGRTYLINESGARQTGWIDSDGNGRNDRYYDAGGVLATGWKKIDGEWYYFFTGGEDHDPGEMATGLTVIDGKLYAMGRDGRRAGAGKPIDDIETGNGGSTSGITNRNGIVQIEEAGFIRTSDGSEVYVGENGKVVTDRWVQDTVQVSDGNGGTFEKTVDVYVGSDGKRETGITIIDGKVYALDDNGAVDDKVRDSMGSGWYKYDENGKLTEITGATPEELSTAIAAATDAIFVNDDGTICTGWINEGGKTYYYDESGHRVKSGTCKIGRKLYGFNESGELLQTGIYKQIEADDGQGGTVIKIQRIVTDNNAETGYTAAELNGTAYIVNSDGTIYTGWYKSADGVNKYYFNNETGEKLTGVNRIGLNRYFFEETGVVNTTSGWTDESKQYYITESGTVQTGWTVIGDHRYYFGKDGKRVNGVFKAGIGLYYQTTNGVVRADTYMTSIVNVGTDTEPRFMAMNNSGMLRTGWQTIDGSRYYFDKSTGVAYTGHKQIDGRWYEFSENGKLNA